MSEHISSRSRKRQSIGPPIDPVLVIIAAVPAALALYGVMLLHCS